MAIFGFFLPISPSDYGPGNYFCQARLLEKESLDISESKKLKWS
jgi:hypothetical protein